MGVPYDVHFATTGRDFQLVQMDMDCHPARIFPTTAHHMTTYARKQTNTQAHAYKTNTRYNKNLSHRRKTIKTFKSLFTEIVTLNVSLSMLYDEKISCPSGI